MLSSSFAVIVRELLVTSNLYLFGFLLVLQFERAVVSKVMGQVLESYNMSFKDVLKVIVTKMDLADGLVDQLGVVDS